MPRAPQPPNVLPTKQINSKSTGTVSIQAKWWNAKEDEAYAHIFAVAEAIDQELQWRKTENQRSARLYGNRETHYTNHALTPRNNDPTSIRVTYNVIKQCVDTACAKISKDKPRPFILTEDGDCQLQTKAKKLNQYIDGVFSSAKAYQLGQQVFRDACIFGTGAALVYAENDQIALERVLIDEILVDNNEAKYGQPRQLHRKKHADRGALIAMFPQHRAAIESADSARLDSQLRSSADEIAVVESWHLPSGLGAKDGKHAISIQNETLLWEPYEKQSFPFVFFHWSEGITGFYGNGLAEELRGIQLEINKLLRIIQSAQHLVAVPRIWVEHGSNVNAGTLNNTIGTINRYTGAPPIFQVAQAMSPEIYQHLENLNQKAFQITGISQLSAAAQKPAGLNSGIALREYQDIETERFSLVSQRYEEWYISLSKTIIDKSRDLYESNRSLAVKSRAGKFIRSIPWREVNLSDDKFDLDAYPVNFLPKTPAGKLQTVQELMQAGLIDNDTGLALLDFPDTAEFFSLKTAAIDDVRFCIDEIVEHGRYVAPEPFMNVQMAMGVANSTYLRIKTQGVSDDRLQLLRNFITDCQTLLNPPAPPAPPAPDGSVPPGNPPPGAPGPLATPAPPPQSDLLPMATAPHAA